MCGIFALLNNTSQFPQTFVETQFQKGKNRGPEFSKLESVMVKAQFGFHRLAINGLNTKSNQPININEIAIICNGEIYNYKELYKLMGVESTTDSDCEVIIHLYMKYGIEQTLQMLDGVFSFVLLDYRLNNTSSRMIIARDPYGVRPLYIMKNELSTDIIDDHDPDIFAFASELKVLSEFQKSLNESNIKKMLQNKHKKNIINTLTILQQPPNNKKNYVINQFQPGTYSTFELSFKILSSWAPIKQNIIYHNPGFQSNMLTTIDNNESFECILNNIRHYLSSAVEKRCMTTERPIACLLSGGLDSSLITALVNEYHIKHKLPTIETYSIGLEGSDDLAFARIVSDYLGTKHTEILLTEQDFLDAIPEVINSIESYDTTSVRASIGNWLLGKYISSHSEAKVIFNGDGSDELTGGYLYMNYAPDAIEFDKECRRLLRDIHAFDVLRSDKSISSHGLEPRTPFLDREWVQYYLSIPVQLRHKIPWYFLDYGVSKKPMEKSLLRMAFSKSQFLNSKNNALLPDEILWRKKEAFSDGVSKQTRSLYEIIQEFAEKEFVKDYIKYSYIEMSSTMYEKICKVQEDMLTVDNHLVPQTAEQFYYRKIFEKHYAGLGKVVPYFWMPKYVDSKDASARTLKIYND